MQEVPDDLYYVLSNPSSLGLATYVLGAGVLADTTTLKDLLPSMAFVQEEANTIGFANRVSVALGVLYLVKSLIQNPNTSSLTNFASSTLLGSLSILSFSIRYLIFPV